MWRPTSVWDYVTEGNVNVRQGVGGRNSLHVEELRKIQYMEWGSAVEGVGPGYL